MDAPSVTAHGDTPGRNLNRRRGMIRSLPKVLGLVFLATLLASVTPVHGVDQATALEKVAIPAFPGAEGAGAFTRGGRGGRILEVTHLNDSGPGSLREAVEAKGPRIVVFRVSGIITLDAPLSISNPYITIAGQTAPGDGICIRGQTTEINTHDVVLRYLRFRRGNTEVRDDALGGYPTGNVIIDHCSASWGLDENLSMYRYMKKMPDGPDKKTPVENVTIQWCISSEALDLNNHAFGSTWGGRNCSFHHNLFACNTGRNPSIGWGDHFDFRNNVLFNWRHRTVDGGDASSMVNIVANYYKPGPATNEGAIRYRVCCPQHLDMYSEAQRDGKWYVADNVIADNPQVTADNWNGGVQFDDQSSKTQAQSKALIEKMRAAEPIPAVAITQQSAEQAYELVLAQAGATLPKRDPVDTRIIDMVRTGKTTHGNGIVRVPADVGGWPEYESAPAPADSDHDAMPDDWERRFGLKPDDSSDGVKDADGDGYTNVEEWLNNTDPTAGDSARGTNPQSTIRNPQSIGPVDWQAKWITADRTDKDPLPIFRKAVQLGKPVKQATLHICGLGHYVLTINGRRVGDHEMDPGWTNYRKTCLYSSYDVTGMLETGENVIGVMLGNGMYNVPGGRYTKFKGTFGPPKLICQMDVTFADGSTQVVVSDETWKCALGPIVFTCIYGGEDYDARREQVGWDRPGFEDGAWSAARVCDGPGGTLVAQYAPPVKVADYLPAVAVQRLEEGQYEVDCGTNLSARPLITVKGSAGSQVVIKVAEKRGQPWTANGGHIYTYTLKGGGEEIFRPRFTYFSFQYLYISGVSRPEEAVGGGQRPLLLKAGSEFLTSSAAAVGGFECSNALFNDINAMIDRSVRSNLQSVLTDCPHREKLGWLEVAHLMGPSILYHRDVQGLFRKICRDTTDSQLENGLVPDIAPEYTRFQGGFFESGEWGSACVQLPNLLYIWYADRVTQEQQYETMRRYTRYLASTRNSQGLAKPGLGDWYDWTPEKGHVGASQLTPAELPATAFLFDNARIVARVAGQMGKKAEAEEFGTLARQVREDFIRAYYKPAEHSVATGSQASLATAIYFGLVPDEGRERVLANLVADVEKAQYRQSTGEVCFRMLVQALALGGRCDVVYRMINRTDAPGYGHMLALGFKTLSERWDMPGSSMNHCMFGHIQEWFQGFVVGIRQAPDSVGFKHLLLRPEPVGELTSASGHYDSIRGRIESQWRIENGCFHWRIAVPPDTDAEAHVPTTDVGEVTEGGRPVDQAKGIVFVRMDPTGDAEGGFSRAVFKIGPGRYEFQSPVEARAGTEFVRTEKPRVIVLTDISNEPDDEESLVRFLVYSNEYDVEGLIATTSVWLKDTVRPERIRERVEAYGQVRDNLLKHAPGYPTKEHLLSVIRTGRPEFGMDAVGEGKSSEGSRHIIAMVDKPDERPVWVCVWGGANCLAQALWDVKHTRGEKEVDAFVSKLRVYTISDQDNSGRWMRITFPNLFHIVSPSSVDNQEYQRATWTGISGDRLYQNGPMHKFELVDNPWLEKNIIQDHGPLGALYPRLKYIMEGDSPSFFNLINNGLGSSISPSYGGWGGRYVLHQAYGETRPIWTNARGSRDTVVAENGMAWTCDQATIWRWREPYQHDFAARMDWCVADSFEKANHNPIAAFGGDASKAVAQMRVKSGQWVTLSAAGTRDPDGNKVACRWFVYNEAGTFKGPVEIENSTSPEASLVAPQVDEPKSLHVILETRDDGRPPLYSYRRVIVTIEGK